MPDSTRDALMDLVGGFYETASGHQSWTAIGAKFCSLFSADYAVLAKPPSAGGQLNLLIEQDRIPYRAYYHKVDPFRAIVSAKSYQSRLCRVSLGPELVPDSDLLQSEYYNDYGRHHGQRHMIGGMLGVRQSTPIALFRGDSPTPFGEEDRRHLAFLMPHLQRALELRSRLRIDHASLEMSFGTLNALATGIVIVDAGARIVFANTASETAFKRPASGITTMKSGPSIGGASHLTAHHRDDARILLRLIATTAAGGPGGSLRLRPREDGTDEQPMQVVLVSQVPRGLIAQENPHGFSHGRLVLVSITDLAHKARPAAAVLCDLFGLSKAEADVALMLVGGAIAEDVAAARCVSLDTVRGQIRAILRKSESASLRDLERRIAMLSALAGSAADQH